MSRRRAALGALLAIAALALGACGGDDSGAAGSRPPSPPPTTPRRPSSSSPAAAPSIRRPSTSRPPRAWSRFARSSPAAAPACSSGGGSAAQGSGFVISDDGEIATNAHVVTDGSAGGGPIQEAKEVYVQFADRNQVAADIVGFDPHADVALLKVDPDGLDLRPLELATDEEVKVGQPVAAIGSPFGEDRSLSVGVVSATNRSIQSLTQFQIDGAIQTDASINPGNSGGPLLDADGQRDRDRPADQHDVGRQRGRRLRCPGRPRRPLHRPASRERQRQVRLHRRHHPVALPAARRSAGAGPTPVRW